MRENKTRDIIQQILSGADVCINGNNPWDLKVKDDGFYRRVIGEGSVGLGEAYMDGWWDCERTDEFFSRILKLDPEKEVRNWKSALYLLKARTFNLSSKARSFKVGMAHYDLGNELYRAMLDKRMVYSCAYWKNAGNLDEAQEAKLDLICRKLGLKPGDKVLDIGCGWGSFARYAAERYGAEVVGITVSRRQLELGGELCRGLPVELRLQDYRDIDEKFDHVVSVGMIEHVGYKNYRTYMKTVDKCLKDGGLFLLHTIGNNMSEVTTDPWIYKYIFPNSMIPSMAQITEAIEGLFIMEDWQNLGVYYDATLMSWFQNFRKNWDDLRKLYDDRFFRMWKYYLLSSAGSFRSRTLQVWQMVMSKTGLQDGYQPVR